MVQKKNCRNWTRRIRVFLAGMFRRLAVTGSLLVVWHVSLGEPLTIAISDPFPSDPLEFEATAYCDEGITKSGIPVAPGIVAADPRVLPLGSLIRLENTEYRGIYRVLDTGGLVKGKIIDLFIPSEELAIKFGRQPVQIVVLRYGYPRPAYSAIAD